MMFHILNQKGEEVGKYRSFDEAKIIADATKTATGENYNVEKREWVWSTQTLDELYPAVR